MDLKKLLVFDIETAGTVSSLDDLSALNPHLAKLWMNRTEWLKTRYPENKDLSSDDMFKLKSGLHPEFGRVVCVTFGTFVEEPYANGTFTYKVNSFSGTDEKDILEKTNKVLSNAGNAGFILSGHTIERFDIPFLWKRLLINKIKPANIITLHDKKPWDIKLLDISKFWSGGAWQEGFTSLDTMSAVFGFASPKAEMQANRVHVQYYNGEHDVIKNYCEGDVVATMNLIGEFASTLNPSVKVDNSSVSVNI